MTNPWNETERLIISEILQEFFKTWDIHPSDIRGIMQDGYGRSIILWNIGDRAFSQSFDTVWLRNKVKMKKYELKLREACEARNFTAYSNADNEGTFIIENKYGQFIGCILVGDRGWFVTRKSGNGIPLPVNSPQDATLSLWMLEESTIK